MIEKIFIKDSFPYLGTYVKNKSTKQLKLIRRSKVN